MSRKSKIPDRTRNTINSYCTLYTRLISVKEDVTSKDKVTRRSHEKKLIMTNTSDYLLSLNMFVVYSRLSFTERDLINNKGFFIVQTTCSLTVVSTSSSKQSSVVQSDDKGENTYNYWSYRNRSSPPDGLW